MAGVDLTDADVVTVFDQDLGEREGQPPNPVLIPGQEQHAAGLVGDGRAIRQFRRRSKTEQHGLFVVISSDTGLLAEGTLPFVLPLLVNAVELFVEDWLNN